jgi:hypothetical protein
LDALEASGVGGGGGVIIEVMNTARLLLFFILFLLSSLPTFAADRLKEPLQNCCKTTVALL